MVPAPPVQNLSKPIQLYLDSIFRRKNTIDEELWNIANEELDEYIAGVPHFNDTLECFQHHLHEAWHDCGYNATDCFWADNGCSELYR